MSIINGALAGFGKGLAEVGTAYARDSEKDQDRLLREKLQEERLTSQRELQDAKLEAKIAAATGGGSGKGQNFDKEQLDLYAKLQLSDDGTVPGGDKYLKAITTGDTSALQTAVPATEGNNPSAYVAPSGNMELTEKTRTLLVEKAKVLSQIAKERGFGSAYDDIEKGERTALGNEAARGIIKGKLSEAVDAAVLAAAVRVERLFEVDVGRLVAAEGRLRVFEAHLGLQRRQRRHQPGYGRAGTERLWRGPGQQGQPRAGG